MCSNPLVSPASGPPPSDQTQILHRDLKAGSRDTPTLEMDATLAGEFTRDSLDLAPNTKFGPRYLIESLLGQGGMGKVYRAHDNELNRTVALKLVRPELAANPNAMARFRQELLLASKVSHRNILRIHDMGDVNGVKFISMALIEGMDLYDAIAAASPMPFDRAQKIALQLCDALDAAHAEGVIHRDLKPRNILLDSSDHVYITDFGLAKSVETEAAAMTRTGDFIGTPLYMSPEQIDSKPVDHRTDLYALGLILYEMVTGDLPFEGKSSVQVMHSRMTTAPKNPKALAPDLPNYFAGVIAKCLVRDPANRYQTAAEIRKDLDAGIAPKRALSTRLPKPSRAWAIVAAAMAVAVGGTLIVPSVQDRFFKFGAGATPGPTYYMAILPFKPLGDSAELKYQAEGVAEALNSKLFSLKQVNLASPNNVDRAMAKNSSDQEAVAKELGANLLVGGKLQRAGDRLAITISVWDAKKNALVWNQQFTCAPDSLLITEDQIYNQLVDTLKLKLSTVEMARGAARATENSEAYDLYMRGRSLVRGKATAENYKAAIDLFDQATQRDSRFARAYAGIADACFRLYNITKDEQWSEKGLGAAQHATELDRDLPDVRMAVGRAYNVTGKTMEAISEFTRAVELAPNSDEAYRGLGNAYLRSKNKALALANLKKATVINPYSYANFNALGLAEKSLGDTERAAAAFKKVIQLQPDYAGGYTNVGSIYYDRGDWAECIPYWKKALEIEKSAKGYQNLGVITLYSGNPQEAIGLLEEAARLNPKDYVNFGNLGDAYSAAGQKEKADTAYDTAIALALSAWKVNSKDAPTLANLALYYAEKGESAPAQRFIDRARAIDPNNKDIMYTDGVIQHLSGHEEPAIQALKNSFDHGFPPRVAASDYSLRTLRTNSAFQKLLAAYISPK